MQLHKIFFSCLAILGAMGCAKKVTTQTLHLQIDMTKSGPIFVSCMSSEAEGEVVKIRVKEDGTGEEQQGLLGCDTTHIVARVVDANGNAIPSEFKGGLAPNVRGLRDTQIAGDYTRTYFLGTEKEMREYIAKR